MSIVKGASGTLTVSASLITSRDYSIAIWFKNPSVGSFGSYVQYNNASGFYARLRDVTSGAVRHRSLQQFGVSATTSGTSSNDTWTPAIGSMADTDGTPRIVTSFESLDGGGTIGTWQAESSPNLVVMDSGIPVGTKIGMIAIYSGKLTTADETHITGGGDPTSVPSSTSLIELWVDSAGVNTSGSDVTSWVGEISGTTLTPSGTVTEDGADMAPFSYSSGATITQSDTTPEDGVQQSFTTTGLSGTITAATLADYDISGLLSDTDPTTATTYTLDISATGVSTGLPRVGETSTLSITATGGTATTDVVIQPKTGWTRTVLAGALDKSANGFLATLDADLGITSAVGDIIYFDASSTAAITATGVYSSNLTSAGQKTDFVIQQGGSATTVATSQGGSFYPYGASLSKGLGRLSMSIKIGL